MKKIFVFVAALATLVSCGDGKSYYCQSGANRTYTDANAEFDTLSYALGMNLGISANVQQADFDLDTDVIIEALQSELAKKTVDTEFIAANRKNMDRFTSERVRPYMMMKNGFRTDRPDTLNLPALYDENFTIEMVSQWMGYDMGNYVRTIMAPVNLHWVCDAMRDSKSVENRMQIDTLMKLTQAQMGEAMRKYVGDEMPAHSLKLSREWLNEVAQRSGVEMLVVENDTMYYRIENPGSELKATSPRDTVSFRFEAYTRRGNLIESTADRANSVLEQLEKIKADTLLKEDMRAKRIETLEAQYKSVELPTIPMGQFRVPGAIEGMKLVGVGGNITIWLPASMAYGARGNRQTLPNEAIVMNIDVVDVKPSGLATPGEASISVLPAKGTKQINLKAEDGKAVPVKVVPAEK